MISFHLRREPDSNFSDNQKDFARPTQEKSEKKSSIPNSDARRERIGPRRLTSTATVSQDEPSK